jgi:hypothetical protein
MAQPGQANAKETPTTPVNPYPKEVIQIFVDSCVTEGKEVDPAVMEKICSCSIVGIQNRYTLAEFIKIGDEKDLPPEVTQMIESCAQQALK